MSYNIHQQVFALSIASNLLSTCKGTQEALQNQIDAALQPALTNANIGDWTVVWGPTVWKAEPDNPETAPDRVWYIAHNPSANFGVDGSSFDTYVLAVAGTARGSAENFAIDADVDKVVDFNAWVQAGIVRRGAGNDPDRVQEFRPTAESAAIHSRRDGGHHRLRPTHQAL